ncbi:MAG: ABC transporter substrate-binding protein [Cohaesibacter sp.]|nr:ABC transporter substrate-binding protein [Cohaesibacter sp.]MCV6603205.1 ABC transporter substrate-binding protein [Cohaesibacter sp.]
MSIDRRHLIKAMAGVPIWATFPAFADSPVRIVSLDYAAAETLITLKVPPVGLQARDHWHRWVVEPALPDSVINIGQDLVVNMEVIASLKPDLIITTPYTDTLRPQLQRLAPVHKISVYDQAGTPLKNAYRETLELGWLAKRSDQAKAFLQAADHEFDTIKQSLSQHKVPPVSLVSFMDQRHVRVYGKSGLYQTVLDRLGIENAWTRPTNYWGFATVGLEELARHAPSDMHLIIFEPVLDEVKPTLAKSPIWRSMPVVEKENFTIFPPVLPFGMVPSALRFARLIRQYLQGNVS